jgi:hypothetical protein
MQLMKSASTAALAMAFVTSSALAATTSATLPMRATVLTSATASGCSNNPGPFISLEGSITLGSIDAQLRFSNNRRGTHERTEDITTSVSLLSADPIRFAKQPPEGGVGGNPYVYLQFQDCSTGEAIGDAVRLGRCVQGLSMASVDIPVEALTNATITGGSCENSPGPFISLNGEISLSGICATLIFTNNARFTHVHEEDVTVGLNLVPEGQSIVFAKQPPQGGVGGNPYIFLQFLVDGAPVGGEIYLGRCVQLNN